MADISAEITSLRTAVYGNQVRYAIINLANKLNSRDVDSGRIQSGAVTTTALASNAVTSVKIASSAIITRTIADAAVTAEKIADAAVTTAKLNQGAVTDAKIADTAVISSKIADNAVITRTIANNAITADKIAPSAIGPSHIANHSIGSNKIDDGAITMRTIDSNSISSSKIQSGAITSSKLATYSVNETNIADEAVSTRAIADGAVTGDKLDDDIITEEKLQNASVTSGKIAPKSITTAHIQNMAITTDQLASDAVFDGKIKSRGIGESKFYDGAVSNRVLATDSVSTEKIANSAVTSSKIATKAISTAHIQNMAITTDLLGTSAVYDGKIKDDGIGASKLKDNAVLTRTIVDGAVTSAKLVDYAVTDTKLAPNSVSETKMADNAVGTRSLKNMSVTVDKLASESVFGGKIKDDGIGPSKLQDRSVLARTIADNAVLNRTIAERAVTDDKIAMYSIGEPHMKDESVSERTLVDGAITHRAIGANAIGTDNIQNMAVTIDKLDSGAVAEGKIQNEGVTESKYRTGSVSTRALGNGAVTDTKLADFSVTNRAIANKAISTDKIQNMSITTDLLASEAVFEGKIKDRGIGESKFFDGAVSTRALANGAVTEDKIAGSAVTEEKIKGAAITRGKIKDGEVALWKLDPKVQARLNTYVTPEDYGAVGDGVTDDKPALLQAFQSNRTVVFNRNKTYKISSGITIEGKGNLRIEGNNAQLLLPYNNGASSAQTALGIQSSSRIDVYDLKVTTDFGDDLWGTDISDVFYKCPYGITAIESTSIRIVNCEVSLVKDGICANYCEGVLISGNRIRNIGQEPIVTRQSRGICIERNDICWHTGDGILIKAYESNYFYDITIRDNRLHDPKQSYPPELDGILESGGGITCNAENVSDVYLTKGVVITGNHVNRCRYGIQLGNIAHAVVSNNAVRVGLVNGIYVSGSCAYGLTLSRAWAPTNPKTITHVIFSNNVGTGGMDIFKSYSSGNDVPEKTIIFDGNSACGSDFSSDTSTMAFNVRDSIVINNVASDCKRHGDFRNCTVANNMFLSPTARPTNAQNSDCYFREGFCTIENNVFEGTQIFINCSNGAYLHGNNFQMTRKDCAIITCANPDVHVTIRDCLWHNLPMSWDNVYKVANPQNIDADFATPQNVLTDKATGEYITIDNAFGGIPQKLIVRGKSIQDGEPSPFSPAPISVIKTINFSTVGTNLVNTSGALRDQRLNPDYTEEESFDEWTGFTTTNFLAVKPNTLYTLSGKYESEFEGPHGHIIYAWYSENSSEGFIGINVAYLRDDGEETVRSPENAKYVRLSWQTNNEYVEYVKDVQMEEGSKATPYSPYSASSMGINLAGNELCSFDDEYYDYISIDNFGNAILHKRIAKKVLDGSTALSKAGASGTGVIISLDDDKQPLYNERDEVPRIMSSHFPAVTYNDYEERARNYIDYYGDNQPALLEPCMSIDHWYSNWLSDYKLNIIPTGGEVVEHYFKQWLTENNVTVYYVMDHVKQINLGIINLPELDGPTFSAWVDTTDASPATIEIEYERNINYNYNMKSITVDTDSLVDGAVTNSKIANGTIGDEKLSPNGIISRVDRSIKSNLRKIINDSTNTEHDVYGNTEEAPVKISVKGNTIQNGTPNGITSYPLTSVREIVYKLIDGQDVTTVDFATIGIDVNAIPDSPISDSITVEDDHLILHKRVGKFEVRSEDAEIYNRGYTSWDSDYLYFELREIEDAKGYRNWEGIDESFYGWCSNSDVAYYNNYFDSHYEKPYVYCSDTVQFTLIGYGTNTINPDDYDWDYDPIILDFLRTHPMKIFYPLAEPVDIDMGLIDIPELRSLPNGVRDEIVIDPYGNCQLIQRTSFVRYGSLLARPNEAAMLNATGYSKQVVYTGKNLIQPQLTNVNYVKQNPDGSLYKSAEISQNMSTTFGYIDLVAGQTYTLSGGMSYSDNHRMMDFYFLHNGTNYISQGSSITFTAQITERRPVTVVVGTYAPINTSIYPQLELGTTATEYEPYVGGAPSPSPAYPQDIQVSRGNLLENGFVSGMWNNGNISASTAYARTDKMPVSPSTYYVIRFTKSKSPSALYYQEWTIDGTYIGQKIIERTNSFKNINELILTSPNAYFIAFLCGSTNNPEQTGTITDAYFGVYTEHDTFVPYKNVSLHIYSRNRFNYESFAGVSVVNGTAEFENNKIILTATANDCYTNYSRQGYQTNDNIINVHEEQRVRLSWDADNTHGVVYIFDHDTVSRYVYADNASNKSVEFVVPSGCRRISYRFGVANAGDTITYSNIRITIDDPDTSYEPYFHKTVPIPLPSRGWATEVSPMYVNNTLLRKNRDTVSIDKDGNVTWTLYTNKVVIDGVNAKITDINTDQPDTNRCVMEGYTNDIQYVASNDNDFDKGLLSTHFTPDAIPVTTRNTSGYIARYRNTSLYMTVPKTITTVAEANTWFQTHPVTVYYAVREPIIETVGRIDNWAEIAKTLPENVRYSVPELDHLSLYPDGWVARLTSTGNDSIPLLRCGPSEYIDNDRKPPFYYSNSEIVLYSDRFKCITGEEGHNNNWVDYNPEGGTAFISEDISDGLDDDNAYGLYVNLPEDDYSDYINENASDYYRRTRSTFLEWFSQNNNVTEFIFGLMNATTKSLGNVSDRIPVFPADRQTTVEIETNIDTDMVIEYERDLTSTIEHIEELLEQLLNG